jgi:hypothetical protein
VVHGLNDLNDWNDLNCSESLERLERLERPELFDAGLRLQVQSKRREESVTTAARPKNPKKKCPD